VEPFNARQVLGDRSNAKQLPQSLHSALPLVQSCSPTACEKGTRRSRCGELPSLKLHRLSLLECRSELLLLQHHTRRSNHACLAFPTLAGISWNHQSVDLVRLVQPPSWLRSLIKSRIISLHLGTHPPCVPTEPSLTRLFLLFEIVTPSPTRNLAHGKSWTLHCTYNDRPGA
jgi:hypothetical protein